MNRTNKKWDKREQEWATKMNNWRIKDLRELLSKIDNDPDSEKRKSKQICRHCHYQSRLSGSAFTNANCGKCNSEMSFSSTDVDLLCKRCAIMVESCTHCGCEMN